MGYMAVLKSALVAAYKAQVKERERIAALLYEYLPRIGELPEKLIRVIENRLKEEDRRW